MDFVRFLGVTLEEKQYGDRGFHLKGYPRLTDRGATWVQFIATLESSKRIQYAVRTSIIRKSYAATSIPKKAVLLPLFDFSFDRQRNPNESESRPANDTGYHEHNGVKNPRYDQSDKEYENSSEGEMVKPRTIGPRVLARCRLPAFGRGFHLKGHPLRNRMWLSAISFERGWRRGPHRRRWIVRRGSVGRRVVCRGEGSHDTINGLPQPGIRDLPRQISTCKSRVHSEVRSSQDAPVVPLRAPLHRKSG